MWNYAELSQLAAALGGPEKLLEHLTKKGVEIGIKQAKGKYGLFFGLGFASAATLLGIGFLIVSHFKKDKTPVLSADDAAAQALIDGIKAYDEEASKNPDITPLPEISREEAEARIDQYVQEVANEMDNGKKDDPEGLDELPKE